MPLGSCDQVKPQNTPAHSIIHAQGTLKISSPYLETVKRYKHLNIIISISKATHEKTCQEPQMISLLTLVPVEGFKKDERVHAAYYPCILISFSLKGRVQCTRSQTRLKYVQAKNLEEDIYVYKIIVNVRL